MIYLFSFFSKGASNDSIEKKGIFGASAILLKL